MQEFLDAIVDALLWIPLQLYSLFLEGMLSVIQSIPVPDWAAATAGYASGIPSAVIYFVAPFDIGTGATIILGAYGVRFLIRRIPVIG